jgi:transposase-like protein
MEDIERHAEMAKALARNEKEIANLRYDQTQRGLVYLDDGMPLRDLLAALGISERTWYRRVKDLRERYDRRPPTSRRRAEFDAIMTRHERRGEK